MSLLLEKELEYFKLNQESLVSEYPEKILVLHNQQVAGVYDDHLEAYLDAKKRFEPGTFMIQASVPGPEAYTVYITTLGVVNDGN